VAGVPALTPELGSPHVIDEERFNAAMTGIYNEIRELDMLSGDPEPNDSAPHSPVDFSVRGVDDPVTDFPGIVRHRVEGGDTVPTRKQGVSDALNLTADRGGSD